jgi:UDP-N-acetylglucosamine:LPS N-acetylglucosamine transferase
LAVVVADNQKANAEALSRAGAALVVKPSGIARALPALTLFPARRAMSRAASALVDGEGADRVARTLTELP